IARAIASGASERVGQLPEVTEFGNTAGLGAEGVVAGKSVSAGRAALLNQRGMSVPEELTTARVAAENQGRTAIMVGWHGSARAVLVVADAIKPTATAAVRQLRAL